MTSKSNNSKKQRTSVPLIANKRQQDMENDYLTKLELLMSKQENITNQDKAKIVYELRKQYPVTALVKYLNIPRSTYYNLLKQMSRPDKDADIKVEIQTIFDEHEGRYGYRRIREELAKRGQNVNHKKVLRIMKILGIKSSSNRKK